MRGFALTEALAAVAVVSLILVVLVSRAPQLAQAEIDREDAARFMDAGQAALALSYGLLTTGDWVLYDRGVVDAHPSEAFASILAGLENGRPGPYRLVLTIDRVSDSRYSGIVHVLHQDQVLYAEEMTWSANADS